MTIIYILARLDKTDQYDFIVWAIMAKIKTTMIETFILDVLVNNGLRLQRSPKELILK